MEPHGVKRYHNDQHHDEAIAKQRDQSFRAHVSEVEDAENKGKNGQRQREHPDRAAKSEEVEEVTVARDYEVLPLN